MTISLERVCQHMPDVFPFPFRLRSSLPIQDIPSLAGALAGSERVELKVSYHGDVLVTWTELAPDRQAAHAQATDRFAAVLPAARPELDEDAA